jgi:hypothetical protein
MRRVNGIVLDCPVQPILVCIDLQRVDRHREKRELDDVIIHVNNLWHCSSSRVCSINEKNKRTYHINYTDECHIVILLYDI